MLNIIYRPYAGENEDNHANVRPNHRPTWFSKVKINKALFDSIILGKEHVEQVFVLFDGADGIFKNEVLNSLKRLDELGIPNQFTHIQAGSVYNSLKIATELACALGPLGKSVYMVEDDYLHKPDAIQKIDLALPELKILSGYDHPDRYNRTDDIDYKIQIKYVDSTKQHWRTSESTGHTYAIHVDLLNEITPMLLQHEHIISDRELWRDLHKINIPLWTAVPGFVTQVDPFLSPGTDWEEVQG
jgi:hypothetical protein